MSDLSFEQRVRALLLRNKTVSPTEKVNAFAKAHAEMKKKAKKEKAKKDD